MNKIERIQYRALKFLHNDYDSDYNIRQMFNGSTEIKNDGFRNSNDLNPSLLKKIFNKRSNRNRRKNHLIIHTRNFTFGSNSLRCLGPHTWNSLPENIKEITSLEKFKESVKNWYGPSSKCSLLFLQKLNI